MGPHWRVIDRCHWQDDHVAGQFIRPQRDNCELIGYNIIIKLFHDNIVAREQH